jgi:adenylate cyclase
VIGQEPGSYPEDAERQKAAMVLGGSAQRRMRRFWRSFPHAPRCKLCHRPFAGPGGAAMRFLNLGPWPGNPKYCRGCFKALYQQRTGAEVECTLLFADVRESTTLAEQIRPAEFRRLLDGFYRVAFEVLIADDAFVDKFVGDEVIGIFLPVMTEGRHARVAIHAGEQLLRRMRQETGEAVLPIGIGVNTGVAYVGAVGTDEHVEFTALGDEVNVTARLAGAAAAGELLATESTIRAAGLDAAGLERRELALKGKSATTRVVVLR